MLRSVQSHSEQTSSNQASGPKPAATSARLPLLLRAIDVALVAACIEPIRLRLSTLTRNVEFSTPFFSTYASIPIYEVSTRCIRVKESGVFREAVTELLKFGHSRRELISRNCRQFAPLPRIRCRPRPPGKWNELGR